jgi:hypothetical protein
MGFPGMMDIVRWAQEVADVFHSPGRTAASSVAGGTAGAGALVSSTAGEPEPEQQLPHPELQQLVKILKGALAQPECFMLAQQSAGFMQVTAGTGPPS